MTPNDIATFGAGIAALVILGGYVRGKLEIDRLKSQRNLDGETTLSQALQKQLDDLYERNKMLTDKALNLATTHGEEVMRAVENVRTSTHESIVRLWAELETAQKELKACQMRHEECDKKVEALEARIEQVADKAH